ncbi:hypothetical protein Pint_15935 [Pistacia integerrima]|uniref:Uncharacterized protein n=1 Tax=Pistacia integerrima TaxID=434235 RepID=A0ACC0ZA59_9ROSI|nr:hypothetical protein Pint_15935 [Pistacia integerrima]
MGRADKPVMTSENGSRQACKISCEFQLQDYARIYVHELCFYASIYVRELCLTSGVFCLRYLRVYLRGLQFN